MRHGPGPCIAMESVQGFNITREVYLLTRIWMSSRFCCRPGENRNQIMVLTKAGRAHDFNSNAIIYRIQEKRIVKAGAETND
jgi:hypothetical protein